MGTCALYRYLFLFLLLLKLCSKFTVANSIVKFLPGFDGPLPFELETGYIGVGESEDVQLFYYFIKSESNSGKDPLILWLTGGPGCSAVSGLLYEIGPLNFEQVQYHGRLPNLLLNPHSWTKVASIIFLDLPVGTGFSYARTPEATHSTDIQACDQAYEFLRKWLLDHPAFISNPVYVGGDSYSGITVPIVTTLISNGNDAGIAPRIDLKGYLLGNPASSPVDNDYQIQYAHGMGLISDELYESLKESCKGKYHDIDPSNALCKQNMDSFDQLLSNINFAHILETKCPFAAPKSNKVDGSRALYEMLHSKLHDQVYPFKCRVDGYRLAYYWANDKSIQEALHVREESIGEWQRCNHGLNYTETIGNSVPYHANLNKKSYRSLIYSGDHDMLVTHVATQAWIRSLNYPITDDWRQWIHEGQVAGYTRTYANRMTFATVREEATLLQNTDLQNAKPCLEGGYPLSLFRQMQIS